MDLSEHSYTINLRVVVKGPDREWRSVADSLAAFVETAPFKPGFKVKEVEVDEATD